MPALANTATHGTGTGFTARPEVHLNSPASLPHHRRSSRIYIAASVTLPRFDIHDVIDTQERIRPIIALIANTATYRYDIILRFLMTLLRGRR
jgi:hypothetical protein